MKVQTSTDCGVSVRKRENEKQCTKRPNEEGGCSLLLTCSGDVRTGASSTKQPESHTDSSRDEGKVKISQIVAHRNCAKDIYRCFVFAQKQGGHWYNKFLSG